MFKKTRTQSSALISSTPSFFKPHTPKTSLGDKKTQQKAIVPSKSESFRTSSQFDNQLNQSKGNGSQLAADTKKFMESRFGQDFSEVRIHNNQNAANMNNAIQARAFTHGKDVYFNEGQFRPHTEDGKRLLAHELAHVVQQQDKPQIQRMDWPWTKHCYRENSSGSYESKYHWAVTPGWIRVHNGPCTVCEGQSSVGCCEPPDQEGVDCTRFA